MVIEMSEEGKEKRKGSWPTDPEAEGFDKEAVKGMAERQAALDSATIATVDILGVIVDEMRRIRCHLTGEEYEPVFVYSEEVELLDETPASVVAPPIAVNLESDEEVANYYRDEILGVVPEESIEKYKGQIEVHIEEDRAILKHGWLGDDWREVAELLRSLGGDWVRDGANSHWILPVP